MKDKSIIAVRLPGHMVEDYISQGWRVSFVRYYDLRSKSFLAWRYIE